MPAIVSSRTRRLYERPQQGDAYCLNAGSPLAQGLKLWLPSPGLLGRAWGRYAFTATGTTQVWSHPMGMVRDYNGTTDRLEVTSAVVDSYPWAMSGWFNTDSNTAAQSLLTVADTATSNERWDMRVAGNVGGDPIRLVSRTGGSDSTCDTTTGWTTGSWWLACAVGHSATLREVYLNGGSRGTSTASSTPSGLDTTAVGVTVTTGRANFFDGRIGDCCIWSHALSQAEVYYQYDPKTRWDLYYPLGRRAFFDLGAAPPAGGLRFNAAWMRANTFLGGGTP